MAEYNALHPNASSVADKSNDLVTFCWLIELQSVDQKINGTIGEFVSSSLLAVMVANLIVTKFAEFAHSGFCFFLFLNFYNLNNERQFYH